MVLTFIPVQQAMVSGCSLTLTGSLALGLGARSLDPDVYASFCGSIRSSGASPNMLAWELL